MRHDVRHAAWLAARATLQVAALALGALEIVHPRFVADLGLALRLVAATLVLVAAADVLVASRRQPAPALDPGEPLTMLGPVWVEHPESDFAGPPRRFT